MKRVTSVHSFRIFSAKYHIWKPLAPVFYESKHSAVNKCCKIIEICIYETSVPQRGVFPGRKTNLSKCLSEIQQQRLEPREVRPHQPNGVVFDRLVVVKRFVQGILLAALKPPLQRGRPGKYVDKFSPTKSGVSRLRVRFRGWLTRVQEIAEDRGLDFVENRSCTKAFGIVSKAECDENTLSPLRIVCDVMGFYRIEVFFVAKERGRISSEENAKEVILKVFAPNSPFVVC